MPLYCTFSLCGVMHDCSLASGVNLHKAEDHFLGKSGTVQYSTVQYIQQDGGLWIARDAAV
jgi:hypothetical protein